MTTKYSKADKEESKAQLLEMIKPGDTIYTKLVHVSRSGMYRVIDLYVMQNNEPIRISYSAARLLEGYDNRHEGCKASGCGMDMGFALVYDLSHTLYPEYDCLSTKETPAPWRACPSPDHVNSGECRNITHHKDGYALRHRWL